MRAATKAPASPMTFFDGNDETLEHINRLLSPFYLLNKTDGNGNSLIEVLPHAEHPDCTVARANFQRNDAIVHGSSLKDFFATLARTLEMQSSSGCLASIMVLDADGKHLRHGAAPSLPEAYNNAVDGIEIGHDVGCCGTAAYTKHAIATEDIAKDPLWARFKHLALMYDLRSCWSRPILSSSGQVLGTFALYNRKTRKPSSGDIEMVDLFAHTAAVVMERHLEIQEHLNAAIALRESERRFRTVADAAPALLWITEPSGECSFLSRGWYEFTGQTEATGLGFGSLAAVHPEDLPAVRETFYAASAAREPFEIDYRLRRSDGVYRWMIDKARPHFDPDGNFLGFVGSVIDISDRKMAEEALRKGEAFTRGILENSPDCVKILDNDGCLLWMNSSGQRLMGIDDLESIRGEHWPRLWNNGSAPNQAEAAIETAKAGGVARFEGICPTATGDIRWWDVAVVAIPSPEDQLPQLLSVSRDITQQRLTQDALFETSRRLHLATAAAQLGTWDFDPRTRELHWDERSRELFEVGAEAVVSYELFLSRIHPDDRQVAEACINEALDPNTGGDYDAEYRTIVLENAATRWIRATGKAFFEDGTAVRFIGTTQDISERKSAEKELELHRQDLQKLIAERTCELEESHTRLRHSERMAAMGTLSAGLGHDMGNLLVPVRVRLESLSSAELAPQFQEDVEGIKTATEYLQRLANGLRMLAIDPERERSGQSISLAQWWADAGPMLKNALPRGIVLESDLPVVDCSIAMSPSSLTQVVFNLVQNAGDAMRRRGTGVVRVIGEQVDDIFQLTVSDDGPGMCAEVRSRCMEPFFTTKPRGISTGLGLALVFGTVHEAGGSVRVQSELGRGTSFILSIPVAAVSDNERKPGYGKLAVVDVTDARLRGFITGELKALSYQVLSARDAQSAAGDIFVLEDVRRLPRRRKTGAVVILGDAAVRRPDVIALGPRPKPQVIRDALRRAAGGS